MGKPVVGEVVVLPFPQTRFASWQTASRAGRSRPNRRRSNLVSDNWPIPTRWLFNSLTSADFDRSRLNVDSFVRANRLFTVEQSVILYSAPR